MYRQFFGLQKEPFTMTPDPAFLFLTAAHREALAGLMYAILGRKGFVVLIGEAGTGKTTLLARVLQSISSTQAQCSVVLNPSLNPDEFLEIALIDFGLKDISTNKAHRLLQLQKMLVEAHRQNKISLLIIDEAHKLPAEVLEEIRLLSNFERPEGKLLQIVLAGQPELKDILNRQDMRQLKQRIAVRLEVHPLSVEEVSQYLRHRWSKAGGVEAPPFADALIPHIQRYSQGIPRLVNAVCDNALVMAFSEGAHSVSLEHILEAARDLDLLDAKEKHAPAAPAPAAVQAAPVAMQVLPAIAQEPPAIAQAVPAIGEAKPVRPLSIAPQPGYIQPSLERHTPSAPDSSIWKRWAGKLGWSSSQAEIYD